MSQRRVIRPRLLSSRCVVTEMIDVIEQRVPFDVIVNALIKRLAARGLMPKASELDFWRQLQ